MRVTALMEISPPSVTHLDLLLWIGGWWSKSSFPLNCLHSLKSIQSGGGLQHWIHSDLWKAWLLQFQTDEHLPHGVRQLQQHLLERHFQFSSFSIRLLHQICSSVCSTDSETEYYWKVYHSVATRISLGRVPLQLCRPLCLQPSEYVFRLFLQTKSTVLQILLLISVLQLLKVQQPAMEEPLVLGLVLKVPRLGL